MNEVPKQRKVSGLLGTGIFFIPYIFSWFTLKDGYSKNVRIISFVWMVIVVAMLASRDSTNKPEVAKQQVKQQMEVKQPNSTVTSNQLETIDNLRAWASDIPDVQLRTICATASTGQMMILRTLEKGETVNSQELVEEIPSLMSGMDGAISNEYLPKAKIIWKKSFDMAIKRKEKYLQMKLEKGDDAVGHAFNSACRQTFSATKDAERAAALAIEEEKIAKHANEARAVEARRQELARPRPLWQRYYMAINVSGGQCEQYKSVIMSWRNSGVDENQLNQLADNVFSQARQAGCVQ